MWFSSPFVAVVATLALAVVAEPASEKEAVAELVDGIRFKAVQALNQRKEELVARGETPKCHPDNISWRRE